MFVQLIQVKVSVSNHVISYDLHLQYFGYLSMNHIMRSYDLHLHDFPETFKGHKIGRLQQYFGYFDMISHDLHLHDFPETFKGHKMRRLQQYFGSPDCGHRCHLSSACLHNPLMYSTNMQQIQNASA